MPRDTHKGWWCHRQVVSEAVGDARITLVATTRKLIDRCAIAAQHGCVISADGGHKFCLMGWPMTIIGVNNRAGNFGVVALCLSSSSGTEHVTHMIEGFKAAVVRHHPDFKGFEFSMSDSEDCYRSGLSETFRSQPLQCWFHTKQACKKYIEAHAIGAKQERLSMWNNISHDMDIMHNSVRQADWEQRVKAMMLKWRQSKIDEQTLWYNKKGDAENFIDYFQAQHATQRREWWVRRHDDNQVAITTNNRAESCVKGTRNDGGNVVGAVGPVLKFMLLQVENESSTCWDASALREPTRAQWHKADAFQRLIGTSKVQSVPKLGGGFWYITSARATGDDIASRPPVTLRAARAAAKVMDCLAGGDPITVEQLKVFDETRVFTQRWCSCLAFAPTGFCHHRLGAMIRLGIAALPRQLDDSAVSSMMRDTGGKRRAAPCRYAVPLAESEKDAQIKKLKLEKDAEIKKLKLELEQLRASK